MRNSTHTITAFASSATAKTLCGQTPGPQQLTIGRTPVKASVTACLDHTNDIQKLDTIVATYRSFLAEALTLGVHPQSTDFGTASPLAKPIPENTTRKRRTRKRIRRSKEVR